MSELSTTTGSFRLDNLGYTPDEILRLCQLVKDPNPWHDKGIVPSYGVLGIIMGQIFSKAREMSLISDRASVLSSLTEFHHVVKADRLYAGEVSFTRDEDRRRAEVRFKLYGVSQSQVVTSGLIVAAYR